jgi:hypothetical protein
MTSPRHHEEFIENRNKEYKKMEDSRNLLALSQELADVKRLFLNHPLMSKSDKERLLGRMRELEKKLGIEGNDYNSTAFTEGLSNEYL